MTEFVIKLADERGRVMEQSHAAATAEELKARFTQAGYYVYSVKARGLREMLATSDITRSPIPQTILFQLLGEKLC